MEQADCREAGYEIHEDGLLLYQRVSCNGCSWQGERRENLASFDGGSDEAQDDAAYAEWRGHLPAQS